MQVVQTGRQAAMYCCWAILSCCWVGLAPLLGIGVMRARALMCAPHGALLADDTAARHAHARCRAPVPDIRLIVGALGVNLGPPTLGGSPWGGCRQLLGPRGCLEQLVAQDTTQSNGRTVPLTHDRSRSAHWSQQVATRGALPDSGIDRSRSERARSWWIRPEGPIRAKSPDAGR